MAEDKRAVIFLLKILQNALPPPIGGQYEFGCKAGVATTSRDNFVVGIQAFHGNPYDGHTLNDSIRQAERLGKFKAEEVYVDMGG